MNRLTETDIGVMRLVATGGWIGKKPTHEEQESMALLVIIGFVEVDWSKQDFHLSTAGHDYLRGMETN